MASCWRSASADAVSAYSQTLVWKGAITARQQQLRLQRQNPQLSSLFTDLGTVAGQLAVQARAIPDPKKCDAWLRQLEDLAKRKEALERELAAKSPSFRQDQELRNLTPGKLLEIIPKGTALVDFVAYRHSQLDPNKKGRWLKAAPDRFCS